MMDAHQIAEGLLGQIDWFLPNAGYSLCPGADRHTHRNSRRDCRVMVDGAPTIYCVHSSCSGAVEEANRKLRSAVGHAENGGGLAMLLAYQVAASVRAGRLQVVLQGFEPLPLPIQIVYPTTRLLSAKVRTFVDLVRETRDWQFVEL